MTVSSFAERPRPGWVGGKRGAPASCGALAPPGWPDTGGTASPLIEPGAAGRKGETWRDREDRFHRIGVGRESVRGEKWREMEYPQVMGSLM